MRTPTALIRRTLIASLTALAMFATACANGDVERSLDDPPSNPAEQEVPADDEDPGADDVDDSDQTDDDGDHADTDDGDDDASVAPEPQAPTARPSPPRPSKTAAPGPATEPAPTPPPASPPLADGTFEGTIVGLTDTSVTLDLVQVLSGTAAIEAARAAGVPLDEDGTLPNDVYVEDVGERVTLPVAGDGGFQILDCTNGCELVGTTLDALVDGSARPNGGAAATFSVLVDSGSVVRMTEVYLP